MDEREPAEKKPAPGGLRLVQAFINTNDIEEGRDELGSPEELRAWLLAHDLPGADSAPSQADLQKVLAVREGLRSLTGANNGEPLDPAAVEALNRVASSAPLLARFRDDGASQLQPAGSGLDGALARILGDVQVAMIDGTWQRLKACRNDVCRWAFYDHSKNRSGTWCTMAVCGDRLKARAYRQRHRGNSPVSQSGRRGSGG